MRTHTLVGAVIATALTSASLPAEIYLYTVSKSVGYTQTSNAPPATPDNWIFTSLVYYSENEVQTATISFDRPPPQVFDLYEAVPTLHIYYSPFYTTEEDMDLDYPSTTYTLTVERGAGPESADLFLPVGLYCPEIPYFTGDTYDRLQNHDPNLAFDGTINGFTLAPGTNVGYANLQVVENGVGGVLSINLTPNETEFQIPGGLLKPGTEYSIGVAYVCSVETPNAGFATATSSADFYRGTAFDFVTWPGICRGDLNCDGFIDFGDINPFVLRLSDPARYFISFPDCPDANGDINNDKQVDFGDINPFVSVLSGGGGPCP